MAMAAAKRLAGFAISFTPACAADRPKNKSPGRGRGLDAWNRFAAGELKLPILLEHGAAVAADAPTMGGERSAATEQIIPGHTSGMVAQLGCSRFAWRQFGKIDCTGARGPNSGKHARGDDHFHAETGPSFLLEGA